MISKLIYSAYITIRYATHSLYASIVVMIFRQIPGFVQNGISLRFRPTDFAIGLSFVLVIYALYALYLKKRFDRATLSAAISKELTKISRERMERWNLRVPTEKEEEFFGKVKDDAKITKQVELYIAKEFKGKRTDDRKIIESEIDSEFTYGNAVFLKDKIFTRLENEPSERKKKEIENEIRGVIAHELGHLISLNPLKLFYDRVSGLDVTDGGLGVILNSLFEMVFTIVVSIIAIVAILIAPALLMKFSNSILVDFFAFLLGMGELFALLRLMRKYKDKEGRPFKELFVAFARGIENTIKEYFLLFTRDMWLNIARRRNEIEVDRFACSIGYGDGLKQYLIDEERERKEREGDKNSSGLFFYLSSTHPSTQKRIRLIDKHLEEMAQKATGPRRNQRRE